MATVAVMNEQALIDTGLFGTWSYAAFNELKNIDTSEKVSLDNVVECLGKDLCGVGLNKLIGISRTHNHFKLHPGEVIQVTLGSSINNDGLKVENGATVAQLNPVEVESVSAAPIPYMWAYDKGSKRFFPMQFFDGSNRMMQERFMQLCSLENRDKLIRFLSEFIGHVERTGTQDDIGFYIHYGDLMKCEEMETPGDFTLLEETDVDDRRQWVTAKTKEMLRAFVKEKQETEPKFQVGATHWYFYGERVCDGVTNVNCCRSCAVCCNCR